jgi:heme-degrading monooxygenase HmoA
MPDNGHADGRLYTHGRWVVKEGQADAFQAGWTALADWTNSNIAGAIQGEVRLLQDLDDPRVFYSFGPWETLEAIEAWRADAAFQQRVRQLRELLESFEAHTLRTVAAR